MSALVRMKTIRFLNGEILSKKLIDFMKQPNIRSNLTDVGIKIPWNGYKNISIIEDFISLLTQCERLESIAITGGVTDSDEYVNHLNDMSRLVGKQENMDNCRSKAFRV